MCSNTLKVPTDVSNYIGTIYSTTGTNHHHTGTIYKRSLRMGFNSLHLKEVLNSLCSIQKSIKATYMNSPSISYIN